MLSKNLEQVIEHYGVGAKMCATCAFRPGSPELEDLIAPFADETPQLGEILEAIDRAVQGETEYRPFFCHENMPTADYGVSFQPEIDTQDGLPVGYPICAGWCRETQLQIADERRGSNGKRFPSYFRVWDRLRAAS